jgi:hypothetical protein
MRYDMASEIEVSTKKEREMRRLSLEDIEEAYLGLMNAYSMCLASLIVEKRKLLHYMVPLTLRWRTKKRVDMLRATLLLLITAEKKEDEDSEIIKKYKLYCDDMKSFSDQIANSGYMSMLFGSTPAIILLLFSFINRIIETPEGGFKNLDKLNQLVRYIPDLFYLGLLLMSLVLLIQIILLFLGFIESGHIFNRFGVNEKDMQFYKLVKNYSAYD